MLERLPELVNRDAALVRRGAGWRTMMGATRGLVTRVVLVAVLGVGATPSLAAGPQQGADQVVEGAKKIGKGIEETAKGLGATVTEGAKKAEQQLQQAGKQAKPVGDRLHDRAKGFGEALWDGMKYLGRTVAGFFK